jgi:hypothetical protein
MMMKNLTLKIALILPLIFLIACGGVHPKPIAGPTGNSAYSMLCSGIHSLKQQCLDKAQALCPHGYTIIPAETFTVEYADSGDGFHMPPKEYMGIECKSMSALSDT